MGQLGWFEIPVGLNFGGHGAIWSSQFLSEGRKLRPDHTASATGSKTVANGTAPVIQRGQWALLSDFTPVSLSPAGM